MSKIIKLFNTVRYLKLVQIIYQLKYRIFHFKYSEEKNDREVLVTSIFILIPELDCNMKYLDKFQPAKLLEDKITLLNDEREWQAGKWIFDDATHLWNFNLHYFEYAVVLGTYWQKEKDIRYYIQFKKMFLDWHNTNKYGRNDAWHPYTVSMRIPNLLIGIELFSVLLTQDKELFSLLNSSIKRQYEFLLNNLEKNLLANHYFENLKTLYLCSCYFNAHTNKNKIKKIFIRQIKEQILADGMHFERSFMYHRIILEDLLRILVVESDSEYKDKEFIYFLTNTVKKMTDCMFSLEKDMGKIPLFNDAGEGVAKEVCHLLKAVKRICGYLPVEKLSYEQAGYYKMRNQHFTILVDSGVMGPDYMLGHAHCDTLSFELSIERIPVFVNAGTYQYQCAEREYFRSTRAHNTIQCDNFEQAECWGEHRVGRRIHSVFGQVNEKYDTFEGGYYGYHGEKITRQIYLKDSAVLLKDCVTGTRVNKIRSYFHIHPDCKVKKENDNIYIFLPNTEMKIIFSVKDAEIVLHKDNELAQYSQQFGIKRYGMTLEVINTALENIVTIQII